jgi:hypothetical protein
MSEAMSAMSPKSINFNDRHVCIVASLNKNATRLFLFDGNIHLGNEFLTGRRQGELDECLSQGMRFLLRQEKDGPSERIAAVFDGGALRFDFVDRQEFDWDTARDDG